MQTCKHCGQAAPQLQGILVLERDGAAWYTECCVECKAKYECENAFERERRMKQRRYTDKR